MKRLSAALFSSAFVLSALPAHASSAIVTAEPLEVVVTAQRVIVGKNVFDYAVLDNAPEKA